MKSQQPVDMDTIINTVKMGEEQSVSKEIVAAIAKSAGEETTARF